MALPTRGATTVRRLPVPLSAPPFDDELGPRPAPPPAQGALALAYRLPDDLPVAPEPPPQLRLVDPAGRCRLTDDALELAQLTARRPTPTAELPDVHHWSARLAQGVVEVLCGHRPVHQLLRWTEDDVYAALVQRSKGVRPAPGGRPLVRTLHVCQPADGVVEASAVVQVGGRCRALALRLEGLDGRWRCTAADLV